MIKIKTYRLKLNFTDFSKLICIVFWMCCISCNSQSEKCKDTNSFKTENIKTYEATFSNGKPQILDSIPKFTDVYTYNTDGNLVKIISTTLVEDGKFVTITNYNYDNELLKEIIANTYHNNEKVDEWSETQVVLEHNKNRKPTLFSVKNDSIHKIYTYDNCLESSEKIMDLSKSKIIKEREQFYNEKGDLTRLLTKYYIEEESTEELFFTNYEYNQNGDWISRVIKRRDDSFLVEKREIVYR